MTKIAILEPYIGGFGGAQRVIGEYANYLNKKGYDVEILTPRYDPSNSYSEFKNLKIKILKPSFKLFVPFIFLFKKFKDYDIIITNDWPTNFSSIRNKNVIWICYSPKRDFYDLREYYYKNASSKSKIILFLKRILFEKIDKYSAEKSKVILAISKNIQKRIKKYYKKDSEIFYPGIYYKDYKEGNYKDYFLSVARLVKPKRVDYIIKSAGYVKDKKIKIFIVGDGPLKEEIEILYKGYSNVKFFGGVDDIKLKELYSNCLGVIYVPVNEDWGLVPIEAAASGKLTIGSNEGGLKETIIDGKTGFLLNNISPEKISEKIDYIVSKKIIAKQMGRNAKKYCKKFDWNSLMTKLEESIKKISENSE